MPTLDMLGTVMFVAAALGLATFVVLYFVRSPWRATPEGRQLMGFMGVVTIIMALSVLFGLILTEDSYEDLILWLRALLYSALAFVSWRFVYLLLRAQRRMRQRASRGRRVTNGEDS